MRIVVAGFLVVISVALFVSLQCTAKATAQASVAASPYLIERVANNDWLLIDVRSPQEFADGHIPGAVNMPHEKKTSLLSFIVVQAEEPNWQ